MLRAGRMIGSDDAAKTLLKRVKQTASLVDSLSQLKGAAMKAGQLLSIEASDFLPPEITAVLRELYEESAFMPLADVERILLRELGHERLEQIKDLSPEPVASASIGQVHRATIKGKTVAVKVQFPGVATSIDADLGLLKKLVQGFLIAGNKPIPVDELFEGLAANLRREVNYTLEAESVLAYRRGFAGIEGYVVPELYADFTTERVITMSFEEGVRLVDWIRSGPTPAEKMAFASRIVTLLGTEFFRLGLVQTDPNYGNFLYRPNTGQLVLLDFGATYPFDVAFRHGYRKLAQMVMIGSDTKIMAQAEVMKVFDRRESVRAKDAFLVMVEAMIAPFVVERQPFDFGDLNYLKKMRESVLTFVGELRHTAPPRDIVFLNRKLGGMFHLLKELGAKLDLVPFWKLMNDLPIE